MPIKITPKQLEMLRANIPNYKKNISENEKNLKPNKPSERGEGNKRDATLAYYGDRELNEAAGIAKPILSKISNFLQTLATPMFAGKNPDGTPYYGTDKGIRNVDLFNQYEPTAYPGVIAGVKGISPNPRYIEFDKEGDFKPWDEAWAKALGLPNKGKYIVESPYKPTSAKKDGKYYRLKEGIIDPNKILKMWTDAQIGKKLEKDEKTGIIKYMGENASDLAYDDYLKEEPGYKEVDPLQRYQLSQGKDDKGDYVSLYDIYDFNSPILKKAINPYEFYDRVYYKTDKQGNKIPIKITPDNTKKNLLVKTLKSKQSGKANK